MQGSDAVTEVWGLMGRAVVDICGELSRQEPELAGEGRRQSTGDNRAQGDPAPDAAG